MGKLTAPISMAANFRQRWNPVLFRATTALSVSLGDCGNADVFGESDDGFKTVQGASCAIRPLEPWRPQPHPRVLQRSLDSAVWVACLGFECGEGPPGPVGAGKVRDDLLSRQGLGGWPPCTVRAGCRTGCLPGHLSHQRQPAARTLRPRRSSASRSGGHNSSFFAGGIRMHFRPVKGDLPNGAILICGCRRRSCRWATSPTRPTPPCRTDISNVSALL